MLPWLGELLTPYYGPFRLLTSHLFLLGLGTVAACFLTWYLLPRYWRRLPRDRGRAFAVSSTQSVGKPVGAGILFIPIFIVITFLVLPLRVCFLLALAGLLLAAAEGFLDDKSRKGWSELERGLADVGISLIGALAISQWSDVVIWLPLVKNTITVSHWIFIPFATGLIWLTINSTNCTDGVDGLSASLTLLAFTSLGAILYAVVGHQDIARYLLVPHYPDGAFWATMGFIMAGCLAGYLWHNANPSAVLMGDAGSRPIGFLLGVLVLASGNPFLIFVVAGVVLINGATGLLKVGLLRFFKINIFKNIRYPLHDHVRHCLGWSNTQVLVRFVLIQAVGTPLFLLLLLKVR